MKLKTSGQAARPQQRPGYLFVLPWSLDHLGGVNEVVKNLIRHMLAEARMVPLVMDGTLPNGDANGSGVEKPSISLWGPWDELRPARAMISFLIWLPVRLWKLYRLVKAKNILVINPHFPTLSCLHFALLKRLGLFRGKLILSFHLNDIRMAGQLKGWSRQLWKMLLRAADVMVTPCEDLKKDIRLLDGSCQGRLVRISNGVTVEQFNRTFHELDRLPLSIRSKKVVLSIGKFEERKGHDIVIRAFQRVAKRCPAACLVLVGGAGPAKEAIAGLIRDCALETQTYLIEDVPHDRIPIYLHHAEVFVLASRAEAAPLVLLEAAASRTAVVATKASGVEEMITDRVTGRLVAVDDHVGVAEAVVDLLENPGKAEQLAANLYKYVSENLTWKHTYEGYLSLLGFQDQRLAHKGEAGREQGRDTDSAESPTFARCRNTSF